MRPPCLAFEFYVLNFHAFMFCLTSFDMCVLPFKWCDQGHKRKRGEIGKGYHVIFKLFICCTIRNTSAFTVVTGHGLQVHWPLKVKTRKSQVTNTKYSYTKHILSYRLL